MIVVVVVLPSDPVTAISGQGQTSKKDLHLGGQQAAPRHRRRQLRHVGPQAGVRKITSSVRSFR